MIGVGAGCYTFIPQFEKMKADAEALEKKRQEKLKMLREGIPEGELVPNYNPSTNHGNLGFEQSPNSNLK